MLPFLFSGCTTLPKSTHENRASIKRFNFSAYYHAKFNLSMTFVKFHPFLWDFIKYILLYNKKYAFLQMDLEFFPAAGFLFMHNMQ